MYGAIDDVMVLVVPVVVMYGAIDGIEDSIV